MTIFAFAIFEQLSQRVKLKILINCYVCLTEICQSNANNKKNIILDSNLLAISLTDKEADFDRYNLESMQ